ncbi:MAG: GAF domain-containing protein [Polyangiaceae bacterium]|nr:GAF domain-containing protein [Polyangiaceae bacterium]
MDFESVLLDLVLPGPSIVFEDLDLEELECETKWDPEPSSDPGDMCLPATTLLDLAIALSESHERIGSSRDVLGRYCQDIVQHLDIWLVDIWLRDDPVFERLAGYCVDALDRPPSCEISVASIDLVGVPAEGRETPTDGSIVPTQPWLEQELRTPPDATLLTVPLVAAHRNLGVLNMVSLGRHSSFLGSIRLRRWLAAVVSKTILEADAARTETAHRRLAELGSAASDWNAFLNALCLSFLPSVFRCQAASAFLMNDRKDCITLATSTPMESGACMAYSIDGPGLTTWVAKHGLSLRIPDDVGERPDLLDQYTPRPQPSGRPGEKLPEGIRRQFLGVPLCCGDQVVGVLRLCGRCDNRRLSAEDERLANSLAPQIAQIYTSLRALNTREQREATLRRVIRELHSRRNEHDLVFVVLTAITCQSGLAFNRAIFWSFDEASGCLRLECALGSTTADEARDVWETLGSTTFEEMLAGRPDPTVLDRPLYEAVDRIKLRPADESDDLLSQACGAHFGLVADLDRLDNSNETNRGLRSAFGPQQCLLVPVRTDNRLLGLLYADNAFDKKAIGTCGLAAFSEVAVRDLDRTGTRELLLDAFAGHLGTAMQALRENKTQLRLNRFNDKIAKVLKEGGDRDSVTARVLRVTQEVLEVDRLALYHCDWPDRALHLLGCVGFSHAPRTAPDDQPMMDAALQGFPYFTSEAIDNSEIDHDWREQLDLSGPTLAFPLEDAYGVSGVLVVNDPRLTQRFHSTLRGLSPILGVAVSRIALTDKLVLSETIVRLLTDIPREFRLSGDEESFANNIALRLRDIVRGSQLCAIYRPRGEQNNGRTFERLGYAGYPKDIRRRVVVAQTGAARGLTSHVLTGQIVNVPSVTEDARWSRFEAEALARVVGTEQRAFLGVPLVDSNKNVIGAVTLTSGRRSGEHLMAFRPAEVQVVLAVAQGLATVLELRDSEHSMQSQLRTRENELDERIRAAHAAMDSLRHVLLGIGSMTQRLPGWVHRWQDHCESMLGLVAQEVRGLLRAEFVVVVCCDHDRSCVVRGESGDSSLWREAAEELGDMGTLQRIMQAGRTESFRSKDSFALRMVLRTDEAPIGTMLVGGPFVEHCAAGERAVLETVAAWGASIIKLCTQARHETAPPASVRTLTAVKRSVAGAAS